VYLNMRFRVRTEHNNGVSTTANQQLAALFLYNGLPLLEIKRQPESNWLLFSHHDPQCEAPDLEQRFFEPDGDYVTSARELFRADRDIRKAVKRFFEGEN
jgi:hypothetical protein